MKTKLIALSLALHGFGSGSVFAANDSLPSWNDTAPKKAILAFVEKVTKEGSPAFVPAPVPFGRDATWRAT
jgi:hypothetical protein